MLDMQAARSTVGVCVLPTQGVRAAATDVAVFAPLWLGAALPWQRERATFQRFVRLVLATVDVVGIQRRAGDAAGAAFGAGWTTAGH